MPKFIDLTGQRFGRLIVLSRASNSNTGQVRWNALCDCGVSAVVFGSDIKNGSSKSCGCLRRELVARMFLKHGHYRETEATSEYRAYLSAKYRCTNCKNARYKTYGGRGITFLFTSFEHFLAVLGLKPSPKHSLGRTLDMTNYAPGECFWMTKEEQALAQRNKRALLKWAEAL